MSRVGNSPIQVPKGVDVEIESGLVSIKGPKGQLQVPVSERLTIKQEDGVLTVERPTDQRNDRAHHGLARALVANAVTGVTEGFERHLEIRGVGFRCQMKGKQLELNVGYSHTVTVEPPEGVNIATPEPTRIVVSGIDKQLVGQVAANIRAVRPPDSYHGKGVRFQGEEVRLKPGKAAAR